MIYRKFGKTGETVSAVGLGGFHLGLARDGREAARIIHAAIDAGVTFLDNSWDYHEGESERRMGEALAGGHREKVFLMTKFDGRTRAAAARQIDESLQRLRTDHVDLMQYHENIRMDDGDRFFAEDGPREALEAAREAGKIRYIGFTGHKDPAAHLRTLDVAAEHGFHFDSCQMPLNVLDAHFRSFGQNVLPRLLDEEIAVLGMKPLASGEVLKSGTVSATECLHYALHLPTTVVITGCETMERLEQALAAVESFAPLTAGAVDELLARTRDAARTGKYELFKTTDEHDSTARQPALMA